MTKLITGGSGQIGAELAHILVDRGENVVIFDRVKSSLVSDIEDKVQIVLGDLGNWSQVLDVVKGGKITQIYHMGAMLTSESEKDPWTSFQTNVVGTHNILEAARLFEVEKIMFTSSIGTFGSSPDASMSDTALQRPGSYYGVGKLYCEGLGHWYNRKYDVDFRSIRYPSVVGPGVTTPGHWDALMIQNAILGNPYQSALPADFKTHMIYYKDAARAADGVLRAPKEKIKMMNYNVGGVPEVTPEEVSLEIKKYIPEAMISFPDVADLAIRPRYRRWDDTCARDEWGWLPDYSTTEQIVAGFIQETRENPGRFRMN